MRVKDGVPGSFPQLRFLSTAYRIDALPQRWPTPTIAYRNDRRPETYAHLDHPAAALLIHGDPKGWPAGKDDLPERMTCRKPFHPKHFFKDVSNVFQIRMACK